MKKYINLFLLVFISILFIPQVALAKNGRRDIVIKMKNKSHMVFFSGNEIETIKYLTNNNILIESNNDDLVIFKNQSGKELFRFLLDDNAKIVLSDNLTINDNIEFENIVLDFVDDSKDDEYAYSIDDTLVINLEKIFELLNSGADYNSFAIVMQLFGDYLNNYESPIKRGCDDDNNICTESYNDINLVTFDMSSNSYTIADELTIDDTIEFDLDPNSELGQLFNRVKLIYSTKDVSNKVYIKNINLEDKTDGAIINGDASANELNIDVDVKFNDVNDFVLYKVVVKNNTDIDYLIDNQTKFGDSEYIKYDFEFENDDNSLAARTEKVMYVRITYNKEIPEEVLALGTYSEAKMLQVSLKTETGDTIVDNPKTSDSIIKIATMLVVSTILLVVMIKVEKIRKVMAFVIASLVIIPTITKAQETLNITINAKIEVAGMEKFCYRTYTWDEETGEESYTDSYYDYKDGMTWNDYFLSENKADIDLPNKLQYFNYDNCSSNLEQSTEPINPINSPLVGSHDYINCNGVQWVYEESIIKDSSVGCYYHRESIA